MKSSWSKTKKYLADGQSPGIDMDSLYIHGLMVYTWTHGVDMDSWYRHGLMVLKTSVVQGRVLPLCRIFLDNIQSKCNFWGIGFTSLTTYHLGSSIIYHLIV